MYFCPSIYHSGSFYIFGGYYNSNNIARLDEVTRTWSLAGKLKSDRNGHGVIHVDSTFLVIGGSGYKKTENCVLEGTTMTCTEQESAPLNSYYVYPALFLTVDNYGDGC